MRTELIRSLILLSKMGRPEIDASATAIVLILIGHEKQESKSLGRVPLGLLTHNQFNRCNNPTFFIGL